MNTETPGAQLQNLCSGAYRELLIVAPFIKTAALERLLSVVPKGVELKCVTRWRPEEIASGVSDLEVWSLVSERPDSALWLCPNLHAKFYRADESCLVGSANLTATALGWSPAPNLELLVALAASHPQLVAFESRLWHGATRADEEIYERMRAAVQAFEQHKPVTLKALTEVANNNTSVGETTLWLPKTRFPDALFVAYSGDTTMLTDAARETVCFDLNHLDVPMGLPREAFDTFVGALLLQEPLVRRVDHFVATPQRFGAVRDLLSSSIYIDDATRTWQTLMRWLLHFLPDRYEMRAPNYSEVFGRRPWAKADD